MLRIERSKVEALGFNLEEAVKEYSEQIIEHPFTVDVPKPTTHPLVEYVYLNGGEFEVVDDPQPPPPPPPPFETPKITNALTPPQFHAMVDILGKTDALLQTILALPQPQRGRAYGKVYHSSVYRRDHPLTETLRKRLNISLADFDAAWEEAKTLEP